MVGPTIGVAGLAGKSFEGFTPGTAVDLIALIITKGANGSTCHYNWQKGIAKRGIYTCTTFIQIGTA